MVVALFSWIKDRSTGVSSYARDLCCLNGGCYEITDARLQMQSQNVFALVLRIDIVLVDGAGPL